MQKKKDEIRNAIIKAVEEEFTEKGFYGFTMRGIARIVGISAGNIYTYFKSKEDLYLIIFTRLFKNKLESQYKELAKHKTGFKKLIAFGNHYFNYCKANKSFLEFIIHWDHEGLDTGKISRDVLDKYLEVDKEAGKKIKDVYELGLKDGSLKCDLDIEKNIAFLSFTLRNMLNNTLRTKAFPEDYYFAYLEYFFKGIKA